MRTLLRIAPIVLLIAGIGAPNTFADSLYTYTFELGANDPSYLGISFTTVPIPALPGSNPPGTPWITLYPDELANWDLSGSIYNDNTLAYIQLIPADGMYVYTNLISQGYYLSEFPLTDFETPGVYTVAEYGTMIVAATPEPSSLVMLGFGLVSIGLLAFWRRRGQCIKGSCA